MTPMILMTVRCSGRKHCRLGVVHVHAGRVGLYMTEVVSYETQDGRIHRERQDQSYTRDDELVGFGCHCSQNNVMTAAQLAGLWAQVDDLRNGAPVSNVLILKPGG